MVANWRSVPKLKANCIFNYNVPPAPIEPGDPTWRLSLVLGDPVIILKESDVWYYGHTQANPALKGVFPKEYVHLPRSEVFKEPLVEEINSSLREWNEISKQMFLVDNTEMLNVIRAIMRDVMIMRSTLATGKMTEEEARESRQKIVTKTDFLNHQLGLDLVVRNNNGNVLSAEKTSAVSLYRHHVETSENIQTVVAHNPRDESHVTNSFKIMLNVKNFASNKVSSGDDVDLIISIYEASEGRTPKPLFENYIVENWNRNSKDLDKRTNNLRVLFGDISKNDITDKRLFLICNVVSNGNFSSKNGQSNINSSNEAIKTFNFRKPVGVAAHEITSLFTFKQGKTTYKGAETELACPFLFSNDSETLESTFRKLVFEKKANVESKVFWVNIGIIFGDVSAITAVSAHQTNSISEHCLMANSHNYGGRVAIARKLGLPDVILPSDVRNDLYINIYYGELSRLEKMQDRNIEVTTEVCDAKGQIVRASVSLGVGSELKANFTSLVYYHEGKPRWNEVVRVTLPADQFAICHLRFTFRHRSRRNEKSIPWAMAFMKLVSDHDGTAVKDQVHDLLVYKIEKRVDVENTSFYLSMPHLKSGSQSKSKTLNGLTPLPKDVFHIQTTLASTKLTQNEGLLSLLKWKSEPDRLAGSLSIFDRKVTAQEFVKFMPDVLDALFSMLMENSEAEVYDNKVFKSLVNVLLLITEEKSKFKQFIPVLELYINENFYATLAYNKLLVVLKECVDNATTKPKDLIEAMKCLRYVFKFVVRSRMLFSDLNDGKGQEPFEQLLKDVLMSLVKLMFYKSNDLYMAQGHCLKNTILAVPDLIKIFDDKTLSEILIQMVTSLPNGQLDTTKVNTIKELVHCPLFGLAHCRAILLPAMASKVKDLTTDNIELVPMVTETLGDILDELTRLSPSYEDISELMLTCLRTVIQSVANRKKNDNNIKAVVANMICLLHSMNPKHYDHYINHFEVETPAGRSNLIDFIMEVLGMFRDLVENNVFPKDWNTMIMLQNSVIMKALCQFAHTIRDYFTSSPNFELTAWRNFFKCAITFIKQPSLQLDKFSENKRLKMLKHYGDMRKTMGLEVRQMWFNLGQHKINFVPDMVGEFLEMTLIPETDLRKATIPIFFDMIQCEYYSSRFNAKQNRDSTMSKATFDGFQNELIIKLDFFVAEAGLGDEHFLYLFKQIMMSHCENHTSIRDSGTKYVELSAKLMELLLEYRTTNISNDSKENQMSCIVNLLDFYERIGREDLYIKYLKELTSLHEKCQNHAEAGYTILQYARLLEWTDQPLAYCWDKYRRCTTHRSLKEQLYKDIIDKFDEGKMWEKALEICKELCMQYEQETFDYTELAKLLSRMSTFYNNIMNSNEPRREPEYFRVAFVGRGFPAFLQNQTFVYRGKGCDRLDEFVARILDQFPNADTMKTMNVPTDEDKEQPVQLLQINKVDPIMDDIPMFDGKVIAPQVLKYYKLNEVSRFIYSRPFHKGMKDKENEFASLWIERTEITTREAFPGILQWFPIVEPPLVYELTPLENAIETMQKANDSLRGLLQEHTRNTNPPINPLSMKLKGIIDAAVMGGTAMYEKAFFTDKYNREYPDHAEQIQQLQDLLADQIPLLQTGILIHDGRKPADLQPLHNQLETMFQKMKATVEEKYGKRTCEFTVKKISVDNNTNNKRAGFSESDAKTNTLKAPHLQMSLPNSPFDNELYRTSYNSQTSFDSTPLSKAKNLSLSVIGITRRKSNVNSSTRQEENRGSVCSNGLLAGGHNRTHNTTLEVTSNEDNNTTVLVTDSSRLSVNNSHSRPSSGHHFFLSTSTPNHSRSPSMASNRDSLVSTDGLLASMEPVPPVLPPKRIDVNVDCLSLSNFDSNSNNSGSREDIVNYRSSSHKKKAPPPPPPISINNNGDQTPPTPPKRPPFKPPID